VIIIITPFLTTVSKGRLMGVVRLVCISITSITGAGRVAAKVKQPCSHSRRGRASTGIRTSHWSRRPRRSVLTEAASLADCAFQEAATKYATLLTRTGTRSGKVIGLQPQEFRLLEYLTRHAGQVVTRTMMLENVWDYHFDPQTNLIDVHVSRLRAKIDRELTLPLLHRVHGAGYSLHVYY
jgi:DNA-binding response OmpR family regulator